MIARMIFLLLVAFVSSCAKHRQWRPLEVDAFYRKPTVEKVQKSVPLQIEEAIQSDDLEGLKRLVPAVSSTETVLPGGLTPLLLAVSWNRAEHVVYLISVGADPSARDPNGLDASELAKEKGFIKVYWILNRDKAGALIAALEAAIRTGKATEIRKVLEEEIEPNFHFESGETPLTFAVAVQCVRCVQVLLVQKYNVNPRMANMAGEMPLELARRLGNTKIEEFILSALGEIPGGEQ